MALGAGAAAPPVARRDAHGDSLPPAAFDGRLVAWIGEDNNVHVRDRAGQPVVTLPRGDDGIPKDIAFDDAGRRLLVAHRRGATLWDLSLASRVRVHASEKDVIVERVAFLDGGRLAFAETNTGDARARDVEPGAERWHLDATQKRLSRVVAVPGTRLVAMVGGAGELRLRSAETGKVVRTMPLGQGDYVALAFDRQGRTTAAGAPGGEVSLWDIVTGKRLLPQFASPRFQMAALADGGRRVVTASPTRLSHWSAASGRPLRERPLPGKVKHVELSPDGRLAVVLHARPEAPPRVLDAWTGDAAAAFRDLPESECSASFSPDGRLLVLNRDDPKEAAVYDTASGKLLRAVPSDGSLDHRHLAISPDNRTLYVHGRFLIDRHEIMTGASRGRVAFPAFVVSRVDNPGSRCFAISPDNRLIACVDREDRLILYPLPPLRRAAHLESAEGRHRCFAFSPDGRLLAAGGDGVRLWEVATGKLLATFPGCADEVHQVAFDGTARLMTVSSSSLLLWDLPEVLRRYAASVVPELEPSWGELASDDGEAAEAALRRLAATPAESVRFLARRVAPAPPVPRAEIDSHVADLDSDSREKREAATRRLEAIAEQAAEALREAAKSGTPEVRRQAARLLQQIEAAPRGVRARPLRVVEALELIGTPDAQALLRRLACGSPSARMTREANASLDRLQRR